MKLSEIIKGIDFDNDRLKDDVDWEGLTSLFDIYDLCWSLDTSLVCYHVEAWLCTDSWVGSRVYFLNKEPVCVSYQSARKSREEFRFFSVESGQKVENYLRSLIEIDEHSVALVDMDEEWEDDYKVEFSDNIIHKSAMLNGEKVDIVKTRRDTSHKVEIKGSDGKVVEVDCRDLRFKYNTLD